MKKSIFLGNQGQSAAFNQGTGSISSIQVKLTWTAGVDLDLHAFYKTKSNEFGHIFYGNKGKADNSPYISLDEDKGIGNSAGNNKENLTIRRIDNFKTILIATNIFRLLGFLHKGDNFAQYDGKVIIEPNIGDHIEVPLASHEHGRWCIIARVDNDGQTQTVTNINKVQQAEPESHAL
jgi:tellurite resistance protein TerA